MFAGLPVINGRALSAVQLCSPCVSLFTIRVLATNKINSNRVATRERVLLEFIIEHAGIINQTYTKLSTYALGLIEFLPC